MKEKYIFISQSPGDKQRTMSEYYVLVKPPRRHGNSMHVTCTCKLRVSWNTHVQFPLPVSVSFDLGLRYSLQWHYMHILNIM